MSDDTVKTRKGTVIPIAHSDQGDVRGILVEKDGTASLTEFRRLKEGQPIMGGNTTRLAPIENTPYLAAEITEVKLPGVPEPPKAESPKGKARVGYSPAYAEGWDRIFGKKNEAGEA